MTKSHPVPVSGPNDPIQSAMDLAVQAIQDLATLIQQPILMTILPREEDPWEGFWEPVKLSPWCETCDRHHD